MTKTQTHSMINSSDLDNLKKSIKGCCQSNDYSLRALIFDAKKYNDKLKAAWERSILSDSENEALKAKWSEWQHVIDTPKDSGF